MIDFLFMSLIYPTHFQILRFMHFSTLKFLPFLLKYQVEFGQFNPCFFLSKVHYQLAFNTCLENMQLTSLDLRFLIID
jgi:hypothetical protein